MLVNTALFGSVDIAPDEILHMTQGPYGFDEAKSFVLLEHEDQGVVFRWLQSTETEVPCFVVFNPDDVVVGYKPDVDPADLRALGCKSPGELRFYVIAVVPDDYTKATVNLKSPIVVNPDTNMAMQIILRNADYPIRFPLASESDLAQAQ